MGHELPHLEIMLTLKCMVPVLLAMKEKKKLIILKKVTSVWALWNFYNLFVEKLKEMDIWV